MMCELFEVHRSDYYKYLKQPSHREEKELRLFRVRAELKDGGEKVSRKRVARKNKIVSISKKRFKATTNSGHNHPVCPNLINQNFEVEAPNQVWVGDITYISTDEGWLYLATIIDLHSRMVVGWVVSERMTTDLDEKAFLTAYCNRKPSNGLIFHSDRGSQYASHRFQRMLKTLKVNQSMSGKGNCYDNALAESFFGKLKTEYINHEKFSSRKEAKSGIFEYIEIFYNRERKHSKLKYLSPLQFEEYYYISKKFVS